MKHSSNESRLQYLASLVDVLPELPGVYQYYDSADTIIYVGKAKNLKRRVSQYFFKNNLTPKTRVLVSKICNIKHIVVNSEEDALLLENNMIKEYKPRYNVLLKDDKTYPWIVIKNEPFPRVFLTRNFVRDGSTYFGPYTSISQVNAIFDIFKHLYPIRTCNLNLDEASLSKGNYKVCLKYHIKTCLGPCVGAVSKEEYDNFISEIKNILRGNFYSLIKQLKTAMMAYAEELQFEKAEQIKKKIDRLSSYQSRSMVSSTFRTNIDVFSLVNDDDSNICFINYLKVVEGAVVQSFTMEYTSRVDEEQSALLSMAIQEVRSRTGNLSAEIVVPFIPDVEFSDIKFTVPISGDKKSLLELSQRNAKFYRLERMKREAVKNASGSKREEKLLVAIKDALALKVMPRHIECFDNSNIQGSSAVAACVVFKNCRPSKADYRLFNIKTVEGPDDYASMSEVVFRRYSRLQNEQQPLPDLIVADGGIGQMEVIRKVVEDELSLNIPIIGLAKDSRHRTNEILVGFPPKVIGISKNDQIFRFFTQVQDEVHRFAITFHRKKRSKSMTTSALDEIKGIGDKTKQQLFSQFKSLENISAASLDELSPSIGQAKAKLVYYHFHKHSANQP